jgi:hypothetical protein
MDVEKTIQFILESAAQHEARLATLENGLIALSSVTKTLADALLEHERITREQDARSRERDARLDERIDKLVSAIGALVNGRSNQPPTQH